MADDSGALYLKDAILQLRAYKKLGEKAIAQVYDSGLTKVLYSDANSIAILVKHMSGNMRSRWTMFLTTDGEKPDRNRDSEFELSEEPTREELITWWDDGWARVFDAIEHLKPEDLGRTVTIRGVPARSGFEDSADGPIDGQRADILPVPQIVYRGKGRQRPRAGPALPRHAQVGHTESDSIHNVWPSLAPPVDVKGVVIVGEDRRRHAVVQVQIEALIRPGSEAQANEGFRHSRQRLAIQRVYRGAVHDLVVREAVVGPGI